MDRSKAVTWVVLLVIGLGLAVGAKLEGVEQKSLSGVLIGAGAGLIGMSVARIVTLGVYGRNLEMRRRMVVEENDERNIAVRSRAKAKAFDTMGVTLGILMLIYALIGADWTTILLLVAAYVLIYTVEIYCLFKYSLEM